MLNVNKEAFSRFLGGYSYNPEELHYACSAISARDLKEISVLEFGCGDSTIKLYDLLKSIPEIDRVIYDCYESSEQFRITYKDINCIIYNENEIDRVQLKNRIYDLILIDGPNGVTRHLWYKKVLGVVDKGSVILIDDFNHYKEFEDELNNTIGKNWIYESKIENTKYPLINNDKSWIVLKLIDRIQKSTQDIFAN